MTVRELIDMLEVVDPNATVEMYTRCGPTSVVDVGIRGNSVMLEDEECCESIEDCDYDELKRRLAEAESIVEIAECCTHMSLVDVVNYHATHNHLKLDENFQLATIDDPIARGYQQIEEQMIPVFRLLKEKVEKYRKGERRSGES